MRGGAVFGTFHIFQNDGKYAGRKRLRRENTRIYKQHGNRNLHGENNRHYRFTEKQIFMFREKRRDFYPLGQNRKSRERYNPRESRRRYRRLPQKNKISGGKIIRRL